MNVHLFARTHILSYFYLHWLGMEWQFLAVTGTEDAAAAEAMLEGNGWNVEGAIDFFFATGSTGASVHICTKLMSLFLLGKHAQ